MAEKKERDAFTSMKVNGILWTWQWQQDEETKKYEPYHIIPTCTNRTCNYFVLRQLNSAEYRTKYICDCCSKEYNDIDHPYLIKEIIEYHYR